MGFAKWPFIPAHQAFKTSSLKALAVGARMGIAPEKGQVLIRQAADDAGFHRVQRWRAFPVGIWGFISPVRTGMIHMATAFPCNFQARAKQLCFLLFTFHFIIANFVGNNKGKNFRLNEWQPVKATLFSTIFLVTGRFL